MIAKKYYEEIVQQMKTLCEIPSPTGYTERISNYISEEMKGLGFSTYKTNKGAVIATLIEGKENGILYSAHMDTLGLMVRSINSDGTLKVTMLGGFPYTYAEQENVIVHTLEGKELEGTFRLKNPAVHANKKIKEMVRDDNSMVVVLDYPVHSKKEVEALGVVPGDIISLDPRFRESGTGYIKSRHLDDKASCALLLALAKAIAEKEVKPTRPIHFMFTGYEEVGHGASGMHPRGIKDFIAVDMGVVGDDLDTNEEKVSICRKDSSGPYDYALTKELIFLARELDLAFAVDIYPYYGSDASAAMRAGYDYRYALLGTGVAASHGYERVHREGLLNTFELLANFILLKEV